jgi:hypothetical protein
MVCLMALNRILSSLGVRRRRVTAFGALILVLVIASTWWAVGRSSSGDPRGQVLNQLVPAATALPDYGTPRLPWVSAIGMSAIGPNGSYVIKMEPHTDSCDGVASTRGWSDVTLQAGFHWRGTPSSLFLYVDRRLGAIGWHRVPLNRGSDPQAMWWLLLKNGKEARASLFLASPKYPWEFVATAPPIGRAASGC